ncbi:tetratricopeptide repeat protein [Desulfovibrio sp. JC022]|uniref:tetratricopeptide repeat protein n=1 Tax=Desulfovibrio sp. JC022 TaxID=2593642 RepID=UPI0013D835B8|nr:tetratricopeptide repeat protein [Desulfovibrio sp. JC022]NDV22127.1 tetratricopeptide repeat protein [Desulfovibrio sp. JC022]
MSEKELKTIEDLRELSDRAKNFAYISNMDKCFEFLNRGLEAAAKIAPSYELYFESEIYRYKNNFPLAISLLEEAIETTHDDDFLIQALGVTHYFNGSYKQAICLHNKALEINKSDYRTWNNKGLCYIAIEEHSNALDFFNKAIELNPHDHKAYTNKGIVYLELKEFSKAHEILDIAIKKQPKDYDTWRVKAFVYAQTNDHLNTIKCLDKVIKIKPDYAAAWRDKGITLYTLGNTAEAIQNLEEACRLDPQNKSHASDLSYVKAKAKSAEKDQQIDPPQEPSTACEKTDESQNAGVLKSFVEDAREKFKYDIDKFKDYMSQTEKLIDKHIEAKPPLQEDKSLFFVLRKWNSYTPILAGINGEDSVGGGYFLYHKGEGVVVDPGYNFIDNFHRAGLRIADIKHIVITHAHNDHTVDFESLLSLFYKFNRDRDEKQELNFYLNVSSMNKLSSLLEFKNKYQKIHPISPGQNFSLDEEGDLVMRVLPAYHNDTIAERYAIGVHFQVKTEHGERNIVLTADTGLLPPITKTVKKKKISCVDPDKKEIWQLYDIEKNKIDLLIPHIGSVRPEEFDVNMDTQFDELFYPNHLGVMGTLRVITCLHPELAVISEFGEELKEFRPKLMQLLSEVTLEHCDTNGCAPINVVPGDLPFVYDITEKSVYCVLCEDFKPATDIRFREIPIKEGDDAFTYFDKNHDEAGEYRQLRKATDRFIKECRNQTACYFED